MSILEEQKRYYAARAAEYDEWFYRTGRYDRGEEVNRRWFAEVEEVRQVLREFGPFGTVLELAAGTGIWTVELAKYAEFITAVDSSKEMLALNLIKLETFSLEDKVEYVRADLFEWAPNDRYDVIFFGFWLSHVPPELFETFWNLLKSWLNPGGRIFLVDSKYTHESTAVDHELEGESAISVVRRLNDGHEYRVVKVFHEAEALNQKLAALSWKANMRETDSFFLYGDAHCL